MLLANSFAGRLPLSQTEKENPDNQCDYLELDCVVPSVGQLKSFHRVINLSLDKLSNNFPVNNLTVRYGIFES
jgi:hypothetical protein